MLRVSQIEVIYNRVVLALKGISLEVAEGSIVALLGANGAGKSTTLSAISNVLMAEGGQVTKGTIEFAGKRINGADPADLVRLGIVQVMEGRRLFEHLTVEENLRTGAYSRRDRRATRHDLERVYAYFPALAERRNLKAGYLSGGEQQMAAIGRALMSRPKLLLLDEPSMGLAPLLVKQIFEILKRLNREENVSVLLAEQNAYMALSVVHHGYVMENGQIVVEGSVDALQADEDIKKFYLGLSDIREHRSYQDADHI